ncbi:DPP IV N-terminal domain-containing protein [Clostridium perfringens]|nr:DPP IV N-terminal domain-containing protein [Clostridium perfringens]
MRKAAALSLLVLVILSITLAGCNFSKGSNEEDSKGKKLKLPCSIVSTISGEDVLYYEVEGDSLKKLDLNLKGHMEVYSEELGLAVYREFADKGTNLIITNGVKKHKISVEGNIEELIISPKGTKLLYRYNSGDKIGYKVLDLQNFKEFDFNENLAISGENVRFVNEDQLILYGVDLEKKQSGIYIYNIKDGSYTLEKQIVKAFIDYIDLVEDQVVLYTQSSIDGKKNCYIYNLDNKKESVISNEVGEIESLCKIGNVVYFIGTKGEGLRSLYSIDITNNKLDRLVYDFPKNISEKSKLIVVGDNIYFLGFNDSKEKNALYRYNLKEKSIKLIDSNKGQYIIIK